jgi:hypothetical protein
MVVLVKWDEIPWNDDLAQPGYRGKTYVRDGQEAWLGEFTEDFNEGGWCTDGHLFHVLEGEASLRFKDGRLLRLRQGASGILFAGDADAHRVEVAAGERIVIVAFDQPWLDADGR